MAQQSRRPDLASHLESLIHGRLYTLDETEDTLQPDLPAEHEPSTFDHLDLYLQMRSLERFERLLESYPLQFVKYGAAVTNEWRGYVPERRWRNVNPLERQPDTVYLRMTREEWWLEFDDSPDAIASSWEPVIEMNLREFEADVRELGLAEMEPYATVIEDEDILVLPVRRDYIRELVLHTSLTELEAIVRVLKQFDLTYDQMTNFIDFSRRQYTAINKTLTEYPARVNDILPYEPPDQQATLWSSPTESENE